MQAPAASATNLSYVDSGAVQAFAARVLHARANCRAADAALAAVLGQQGDVESRRRSLRAAAELCDEAIASAHIAAVWIAQLTPGELAALARAAQSAAAPTA